MFNLRMYRVYTAWGILPVLSIKNIPVVYYEYVCEPQTGVTIQINVYEHVSCITMYTSYTRS